MGRKHKHRGYSVSILVNVESSAGRLPDMRFLSRYNALSAVSLLSALGMVPESGDGTPVPMPSNSVAVAVPVSHLYQRGDAIQAK